MDVSEAWMALLIVFVCHAIAKGSRSWLTVSIWCSEGIFIC